MNRIIASLFIATPALLCPTSAALPCPAPAALPHASSPAGIFNPATDGALERARIMMADGNFTGALDQLRSIDLNSLDDTQRREAVWMQAEAAFSRGDAGCVALLEDYARTYPASAETLTARLYVADYYFFAHDYSAALLRYESVGPDALSGSMRDTYTYRTAVSMLRTGHYDEARPLLARLKDTKRYACASRFYTAYADYAQERLDDAEKGFQATLSCASAAGESRSGNAEYLPGGLDAQFYLTQIDFAKGNYAKVIREGEKLLAGSPDAELRPETLRVVGESYFKTGDEAKALRLLRQYAAEVETPAASAAYTLGVLEYDRGDWSRAEELFSSLTDMNNDLAQSAYLYLGQCAVQKGDDDMAAISFRKAYEMNYDPKVSETALYNYAAAATRGGTVPFASSVPMLEDFLRRYRDSEYAPEIEGYLASAYYAEKNYTRALESINRIPQPGAKVLAAKQKILYEAGVEAMSNGAPARAAKLFAEAVALERYDSDVALTSRLWLGDAEYALGNYSSAAASYRKYLSGSRPSSNRTLCLYDLGYALYMQDRFAEAASMFADALKASPALPSALVSDARMRRADCLYYTGNYTAARSLFADAVKDGGADADYASLRHATLLGLTGDIDGKLRELTELPKKYPGSKWRAAALLEKGGTLASLGRTKEAEEVYRQISDEHGKAPEARKGALQLAMAYNRQKRAAEAAEAYRDIIRRWPTSEEARLANEDLKRICAEEGTLTEYVAFLRTVPGAPTPDRDEMERLQFDAAETALAADESDLRRLETYVSDYPDGTYLAQALLDLSDAYFSADRATDALASAERLLSARPDSPQAPEALLIKADILEETAGRRAEALEAYRQLARTGGADFATEAAAGIMRTTDNPTERIEMARIVSRSGGLSAEQTDEAFYYEALGLEKAGKDAEAEKIYRRLSGNAKSLHGAMATVALGEMLLREKKTADAEKLLGDFIDRGTPHEYWLARGFLLLSDVYYAQGKHAKAREYVVSLRDNYPGTELDIHDMINQRLKRK